MSSVELDACKLPSPDTFIQKFKSEEGQGEAFTNLYHIGLGNSIWQYHPAVNTKKAWTTLAATALQVLDVPFAKRIYREILNDALMAMNLERIEQISETTELLGHIAVIFNDFMYAKDKFTESGRPKEALYLLVDLMEYKQALEVAERLEPELISPIALDYAAALESEGKVGESHQMYERALSTFKNFKAASHVEKTEHLKLCQAGYIRSTLQSGDIQMGLKMLSQINDKPLAVECASILENLKQYTEAAQTLEAAEEWDRAAQLWMKGHLFNTVKDWTRVGKLLQKLQNPALFMELGKAKEAEGHYADAAAAYEKAKDYDSVARILIENLQDIEGGAALVRQTRSKEASKKLAKLYLGNRQYASAIEFFLLAGLQDEAFEVAKNNSMMLEFAQRLEGEVSAQLLNSIAVYFEREGDYYNAGKYHFQARKYQEALRMFLSAPFLDDASIDFAIRIIGEARDDSLTHELITFLMGETDGIPKESKYIFKLYISLKQYKEAARTAVIIAREEQIVGNYRGAHDLLLDNYKQLRSINSKVPLELDRMLMIVHSYILVKTLIRLDDHESSARMLIRVANNISKFPAHMVPILTSTVIECHRSGLKTDAFKYAAILMQPEHRNSLDPKFRKKIEQIIRPEKDESAPEKQTPCPFCETPVPETMLDCETCKNHLPYCVATGRHMVLDDWTNCPHCEFPALASYLKQVVQQSGQCPMCSESLDETQIVVSSKAEEHLKGKMKSLEEEQPKATNRTPQVVPTIASASNNDSARIGGLVI